MCGFKKSKRVYKVETKESAELYLDKLKETSDIIVVVN